MDLPPRRIIIIVEEARVVEEAKAEDVLGTEWKVRLNENNA